MTWTVADRVAGCLRGIAVGDAIGKQTEMLAYDDVVRRYPGGIRGFEGAPGTVIPRYAGNSKREWRFGETTDDTERTIAVARAIIADRAVTHTGVGREMLRCTKCIHSGLKSLWEFHQAGDPSRRATTHDGCGAAIRTAPVGVLYDSGCLDMLVTGAYEAAVSTHGASLAIAGAAANAAAVSAAIDGASGLEIIELAVAAASAAEARWPASQPGPTLTSAIRETHQTLAAMPRLGAQELATAYFPSQTLTIVPLALALGTCLSSARDAILIAANLGGDSDSVASIAGGILGARFPDSVDPLWYDDVEHVNSHDLLRLASELATLRRGC